jgi:LacI family transcriptional regulator
MGKRFTQAGLARELGVSQALVSLVLNGKGEEVARETGERIWAAARARGYRPRGMDLRAASRHRVGFVLRPGLDLANQSTFFAEAQEGLFAAVVAAGGDLLYLGTADAGTAARLPLDLTAAVVFGAVAEQVVRALAAGPVRVVGLLAAWPGVCSSVQAHDDQAASLLLERLYGRGHRRIAWLGGNQALPSGRRRRDGLVRAAASLGLEAVAEVVGDPADRAAGALRCREALERHPQATALVCASAVMARGALDELRRHGVARAIAALDCSRAAVAEEPAVTCAGCEPRALGEQAGRLAVSGDPVFADLTVPARLMEGASDPPLAGDHF